MYSRPSTFTRVVPRPPKSPSITGERSHFKDVQGGREGELLKERTELHHLDSTNVREATTTEKLSQNRSELSSEAVMDHLHRGHTTTNDPLLTREVKLLDVLAGNLSFNRALLDLSFRESFEEAVDLFLAQNLIHTRPY